MAYAGLIAPGRERYVFGEGIGPIPVDLDWDGDRLSFAWMGQLTPTFGATLDDQAGVEVALGVEAGSIAGTGLPIQEVSCGSTFLIVPMATRAAVDSVSINRAAIEAVFDAAGADRRGMMIFSPEAASDGAHAYSRMLGLSGFEDPATGSAAGPLGSYLVASRGGAGRSGRSDRQRTGRTDEPAQPALHRHRRRETVRSLASGSVASASWSAREPWCREAEDPHTNPLLAGDGETDASPVPPGQTNRLQSASKR